MMRFKRGDKVEVLTLKEGPSGSWRCAEIIGSNRHHYTVSYEGGVELLGKATIEKVSRKAVRPCPPEVDVLQDWVPDDVVEVFHNISWMMATIVKVLECSHFLVRLLGLGVDIEADKYDIRPRLCWQDGEWIVIGKASNKCEGMRFRIPSSRNDTKQPRKMIAKVNGHAKGDNRFTKNSNIVLGSEAMPLKTVKRKLSIVHSQVEAYARPNKKKITFRNRESLLNQFNAMEQCQSPEKVEKCMHAFLINKVKEGSEMIMEREKTFGDVGYSCSSDNDASVSSSVGSCSIFGNPSHELHHCQYEDNDSQCSDAESVCQLRSKEGNFILPAKEVLRDEIHTLELHAYRCTIGALYASGPLSWEQEMLLTDLRHSLHVSNDEHLTEIRNLVSSSVRIPGHIQRGLCTLALMLRDALICHLMSCAHSCTNFIVFETCHELLNSLLCVWLLHASIRGHVGALKPKSCVFHKNFCGTVACNKAPTPQTC